MRAVLQRVLQASVEVNGQQISKIKQGLCVLVGLSVDDTSADIDFMVRKLLSVRVFDSSHNSESPALADIRFQDSISASAPPKMWAKSVVDIGGEILCVSQFTLYGQVIKGSKPDFHLSMKSETSKQMYHEFLDRLKKAYHPDRIKDGEFGAMMLVNIANDGPVTLELDSRKFEYVPVTDNSSPTIAKSSNAAKAKPEKNRQEKSKKKGDRPEKETVGDGEGTAEEVTATATVPAEGIEAEIGNLSLQHSERLEK